jgi:hypothetical protein
MRCRKTVQYLYRYSEMLYICDRTERTIEIHIFFSFLKFILAIILSYLIFSSGMSGYYVKNNLLEFALLH